MLVFSPSGLLIFFPRNGPHWVPLCDGPPPPPSPSRSQSVIHRPAGEVSPRLSSPVSLTASQPALSGDDCVYICLWPPVPSIVCLVWARLSLVSYAVCATSAVRPRSSPPPPRAPTPYSHQPANPPACLSFSHLRLLCPLEIAGRLCNLLFFLLPRYSQVTSVRMQFRITIPAVLAAVVFGSMVSASPVPCPDVSIPHHVLFHRTPACR